MLVGCTVVLKPSEVTPINAYLVAEACHEAGAGPPRQEAHQLQCHVRRCCWRAAPEHAGGALAGIPPGVFNMVVGMGPECGEALSLSASNQAIVWEASEKALGEAWVLS